MRIAFVTFEYPPFIIGGAGIYAANITRELAELGHTITIFTPKIDEFCVDPKLPNLKIERINIHREYPFAAFQFWLSIPGAVKNAEKQGAFDIIHFNGISYCFHKRRLSKAPHVITIHHLCTDAINSCNLASLDRIINLSSERSAIIPYIEKRCIECSNKIIAVSEFTKERIIQTYEVRPEKIEVVYNGVASGKMNYSKNELSEFAQKFKLSGQTVVLFVGRVDDPRKGLDILLLAFQNVIAEIEAYLLVVGSGDQRHARELSNSLGISDNVIFAGFLSDEDLKKCYALCDLYVSPSRLEGFGMTVLEAMANAKPVVATNVGALSEIVRSRENGTLITANDDCALAKSIKLFLSDRQLSRTIGENNAKYANTFFSWKKAANEICLIYKEFIAYVNPK